MSGFRAKLQASKDKFQMSYQIWDGDLYLYTVFTLDEAEMAREEGFKVVAEMPHAEEIYSPYYGA
jgi:hypothetical protein